MDCFLAWGCEECMLPFRSTSVRAGDRAEQGTVQLKLHFGSANCTPGFSSSSFWNETPSMLGVRLLVLVPMTPLRSSFDFRVAELEGNVDVTGLPVLGVPGLVGGLEIGAEDTL